MDKNRKNPPVLRLAGTVDCDEMISTLGKTSIRPRFTNRTRELLPALLREIAISVRMALLGTNFPLRACLATNGDLSNN